MKTPFELKLNDEFIIPGEDLSVKIIGLAPGETKFMATGKEVRNPEKPRAMSTLAFSIWLMHVKASRKKLNSKGEEDGQ